MGTLMEDLVASINEFDPAAYMPDIASVLGWIELFARVCVLAAPVVMLMFGLSYLLLPAKEANHIAGYRFYFGMGSVEAWRFAQKLAGIAWTSLGLLLTVVMFLITGGFKGMNALDMATKAAILLVWEIVLMAVCCAAVNIVLIIRYDRKGNLRSKK